MDKTVGMIGLGIMGSAIARNLVERGWKVIGYDIDAGRRAELAQAKVVIADLADKTDGVAQPCHAAREDGGGAPEHHPHPMRQNLAAECRRRGQP